MEFFLKLLNVNIKTVKGWESTRGCADSFRAKNWSCVSNVYIIYFSQKETFYLREKCMATIFPNFLPLKDKFE